MSQLHIDIIKGVLDLSTLESHDREILESSLRDSFEPNTEFGLAALALAALVELRRKYRPISKVELRVLDTFLEPISRQEGQPEVGAKMKQGPDVLATTPTKEGINLSVRLSSGLHTDHRNASLDAGIQQDITNVAILSRETGSTFDKSNKSAKSGSEPIKTQNTQRELERTYPYGLNQLLKNGWIPGQGLGAHKSGISTPLQHTSPDRLSGAGIGHRSPRTLDDQQETYDEEHYQKINHDWSDYLEEKASEGKTSPKLVEDPASAHKWQVFREHVKEHDETTRGISKSADGNIDRLRLVHSQETIAGGETAGATIFQQDRLKESTRDAPGQCPSNRNTRRDRWPRTRFNDLQIIVRQDGASSEVHQTSASGGSHETIEAGWVNSFAQGLPPHPAERKHSGWPRNGW